MYDTKLLQELARYGRDRVSAGEGRELFAKLGVDKPSLFEAYSIGYLPEGFRSALPAKDRKALHNRRLRMGNSIILPATNERGEVIDILSVSPLRATNLCSQPQGLLGAKGLVAQDELHIVDTFGTLVRLWNQGQRNVLLLRSLVDAEHNAKRLYAAGVQSATVQTRRHGKEIAKVLYEAGVSASTIRSPKTHDPAKLAKARAKPAPSPVVVPEPEPEPVPELKLEGHDPKTELATFTCVQATYTVQVGVDSDSKLEVAIAQGDKRHRDRFDLAVEAQRKRFASSASARTGISSDDIERHLLQLLDEARSLQTTLLNPLKAKANRVELSATERGDAEAYLRDPNLLDRIGGDLDALGWVGEDSTKALLYLAAISRKLPEPLWTALRASPGAGKSYGLDLLAELTPPEELLHVSRLTDSALYYQDATGLSHKLLVIDEADALTPEVIVALRVLKTRGGLSLQNVQRDFASGETRAQFIEARGPVSVLTSTAGKLDAQLLSRCYELPVDESPEQTERILAAQRRLKASPSYLGKDGTRAKIVAAHRNLQRLLDARPVVIPFAERIDFPSRSVHHRREQERFLALIEASALLHQHQRLRDREHIVADHRDFEIAARLVAEHLDAMGQGISRNSRELLDMLQEEKLTDFTMDDLVCLKPHWTRYAFRAALKELLDLEYLAASRSCRGRLREYRLLAVNRVPTKATGIVLHQDGEMAKYGEGEITNLTPEKATG